MNIIAYIFIFLLGLCIGSFLNVVILRLPKKKKFLKLNQRSKCPKCRHALRFLDLVPLFSFLFLKFRCRYCHKKISWQYPLVEFLTALFFALIFWQYGLTWVALIGFIGAGFLMALAFIDGKFQIVPDSISLPGIIIILVLQLLTNFKDWQSLLLGLLLGSTWFLLQWVVSKGKWVGSGDIRIGALLGVFLGFWGTALALFASYFMGSLWAIYLLSRGKAKLKSKIPFGVFLGIFGILAFIFGPEVVSWYKGIIGL
ncbi:MAG: prepilin peptidase [Patescibacteria group bacterium]|jgi:leader peptidase (prepilin peptidase)/N-methyltransferase